MQIPTTGRVLDFCGWWGTYSFFSGWRRFIIISWWRRMQATVIEHIRHINNCCTTIGRQVRCSNESLLTVRRRLILMLHMQSCGGVPLITISSKRLTNHIYCYYRSWNIIARWTCSADDRWSASVAATTTCFSRPFRFSRGWSDRSYKGPSNTPPPFQRVCNTLRCVNSALPLS